MTRRLSHLAFVILICFILSVEVTATQKGVSVKIRTKEKIDAPVAGEVTLYRASYALVIGINRYERGWPILRNAVKDARLVAEELKLKGFDVTLKMNLDSRSLKQEFEEFIILKGSDSQSRLFIWFAGHGHTLGGEGFLVPTDADLPDNESQFRLRALPLMRFKEYASQAKSKHIFAVFDSCFSGTIFNVLRGVEPPLAITRVTTFPVRQFLSSGDDKQKVSDNGTFRKLFIGALKNEENADANDDGYLTASELSLFISNEMTNRTRNKQSPLYGKLPDFNKGDFVFVLPHHGIIPPKTFTDSLKGGGVGPEVVRVSSGHFQMGDIQKGDKGDVHGVYVKSIGVGCYEVTFEEYDRFCDAAGRRKPADNGWGRGRRPVINVSWVDTLAYTQWLSEKTGHTYRLPTEAEWEYLARAGTKTTYWWGKNIGENNACCDGCRAKWGWGSDNSMTAPVGSFKPNRFGVFDTAGNVWEWTCSEYTDSYTEKETKCLDKIRTSGRLVVIRGGAWDEPPKSIRAAYRKGMRPVERTDNIGFRVVRELKEEN